MGLNFGALYMCIYIYTRQSKYVCIYVYTHTHICIYTCVYVCIGVCICIYIYISSKYMIAAWRLFILKTPGPKSFCDHACFEPVACGWWLFRAPPTYSHADSVSHEYPWGSKYIMYIMPTLGLKYTNMTYFGLFGAPEYDMALIKFPVRLVVTVIGKGLT